LAFSLIKAPLCATLIVLVCGIAGIGFAGGRRARLLVPISGLLLVGVAILGLLPELGQEIGWAKALVLAACGYGALMTLDRAGYPVCPSCSHGEEFAAALVAATAFHASVDGWGLMGIAGRGNVSTAVTAAILIHKVPEGLALGAILRTSTVRIASAIALIFVAEIPTLIGGIAGLYASPGGWVTYALAVVAGMFLFLGLHAIRPHHLIRHYHGHDHSHGGK
jgi:zinc transporter ZupT